MQELASSIAADYPHFYGGAAVPTRDAEFEAWHGPLGGAPQQRQQQQQPFPTLSNPVQAPPRAGVMGMPALPLPNDSQVIQLSCSQGLVKYYWTPVHVGIAFFGD